MLTMDWAADSLPADPDWVRAGGSNRRRRALGLGPGRDRRAVSWRTSGVPALGVEESSTGPSSPATMKFGYPLVVLTINGLRGR